jgi:hypothetical protein
MKLDSKLMVAVLTLASSALISSAQTTYSTATDGGPPHGGPGRHGPRRPPLCIAALDANHDGVIDADEIANASAALQKLDKDGDGKISLEEFLGPRPAPPGAGTNLPPVPPIFSALDANGDRVIDADELANAPAALKTLDKNGDGQLTMDEILPPHRGGRGGPGGFGHRGGPGGPGGFDGPPPADGQAPPAQGAPQE